MPVHQVGKLLKTLDRKIWNLLDSYVAKGLENNNLSGTKKLGLDETSLKKGHEFITSTRGGILIM
jgi:hypothetical protein